MLKVEEWAEIRRLHKVEGLSQRSIACQLGLNRRTVARALASPTPSGTLPANPTATDPDLNTPSIKVSPNHRPDDD